MECLVSDYAQANLINTSTRRKQLLGKMNTVIADLDSSTELFSESRLESRNSRNGQKQTKIYQKQWENGKFFI